MDARNSGLETESITKAASELTSNGKLEQMIENALCVDGWCIGSETRRRIGEWWNNSKEYYTG